MEGAASGRGRRGVRVWGGHWSQPAADRCEVTPCQDWRADAGERFFGRRARQSRFAERKAMIDREHDLPITKQAKALSISRGSVYYLPRPVSATDLEVMRHLDRLHLEFPFAGSRMLRGLLDAEGCKVGRRHVKTLMKRMGIEALYRHPRTTKPEPGHKIYPYLLRGMEIVRPNQSLPPRRRGCGRWTSPTSRWRVASSIWRLCSIGSAVACCRGVYRSQWKRRSASRRLRMLWLVTASRTSSTRTRARSLRARHSPACSPTTALRSAWMARGLGGTTCSSNVCGAASSTRRCTCGPTTASATPAPPSEAISASTMVHHNTHLAMWLKRRGFVGRDV